MSSHVPYNQTLAAKWLIEWTERHAHKWERRNGLIGLHPIQGEKPKPCMTMRQDIKAQIEYERTQQRGSGWRDACVELDGLDGLLHARATGQRAQVYVPSGEWQGMKVGG